MVWGGFELTRRLVVEEFCAALTLVERYRNRVAGLVAERCGARGAGTPFIRIGVLTPDIFGAAGIVVQKIGTVVVKKDAIGGDLVLQVALANFDAQVFIITHAVARDLCAMTARIQKDPVAEAECEETAGDGRS